MNTTLKQRIIDRRNAARKIGDKATLSILTVLIGECDTRQVSENQDVQTEIKKMISNLELTPSVTSNMEIEILEQFMPAQLTEGDMIFKVASLVKENNYTSMKDMGVVMNHFATNYPNQYDGKKLSIITKNQLSN